MISVVSAGSSSSSEHPPLRSNLTRVLCGVSGVASPPLLPELIAIVDSYLTVNYYGLGSYVASVATSASIVHSTHFSNWSVVVQLLYNLPVIRDELTAQNPLFTADGKSRDESAPVGSGGESFASPPLASELAVVHRLPLLLSAMAQSASDLTSTAAGGGSGPLVIPSIRSLHRLFDTHYPPDKVYSRWSKFDLMTKLFDFEGINPSVYQSVTSKSISTAPPTFGAGNRTGTGNRPFPPDVCELLSYWCRRASHLCDAEEGRIMYALAFKKLLPVPVATANSPDTKSDTKSDPPTQSVRVRRMFGIAELDEPEISITPPVSDLLAPILRS